MNITALLEHHEGGQRSEWTTNDFNTILAASIAFILKEFFIQIAPSFVLTLSCYHDRTCKFYENILEMALSNSNLDIFAQVVVLKNHETIQVPGRRQFNFIFVDSYESLKAIDLISYTEEYNTNEYYYIILDASGNRINEEMQEIFNYCWKHYMIHCTVQIQTDDGEVLMYTYYPFMENSCRVAKMVLINQFNGSTWTSNEIFPRKLLNFHGCPLRVGLWNVPPFIYLEEYGNGTGKLLGGFESHLIRALAERLNFTFEIKVPPNNEQRGVVKGNDVNGALLMLRKRTIDFSLGSFRNAADRARVSTGLPSYYQTSQVMAIPLSAYEFTSLGILLFPFSVGVWTFLIVVIVSSAVLIYSVNRFRPRIPEPFGRLISGHASPINVFLLTLGNPIDDRSTHPSVRLIISHWMLFTLVMRAIYQSLLFHLIRTQVNQHVPNTFEELIKNNYTVVMNRATYLSLNDVQIILQLNRMMINDVDDTVAFVHIEKHPSERIVAAGPLDFLLYYINMYRKNGAYHIFPQHIVGFQLTMYLTKHSFLVDQFDEDILRMRSAGLINAWLQRELDFSYQKSARNLQHKVFGMEELHMAFIIVGVGLSLATIVLLLEILSKRSKFLRRIIAKI